MIPDFFVYFTKVDKSEFLSAIAMFLQFSGNSDSVNDILDELKRELDLGQKDVKDRSSDELITYFKNRPQRIRRIFVIELTSTLKIIVDDKNKYSQYLKEFCGGIGLTPHESEVLISWAEDYNDFMETGLMFINSKL